MKFLIVNGPNINVLHLRNKSIYGTLSLEEINQKIISSFPEDEFEFFQSNHEGSIIDKLNASEGVYDGIIINPAAYSHTSYAIKDALEIITSPKIEAHLSNIFSRDEFRKVSVTAGAVDAVICGLKEFSYIAAVYSLKKIITDKK